MYEIIITDSTGSTTLPPLEVPLVITTIEGAVDVEVLDKSIYTDFIAQKRQVAHTWAYLSETLFNIMKGYYDRQFTTFQYPRITITALGISDMPVRMSLNPQNIIDQCGTVEAVTVSFRESKQNLSS
jgi:hypothetical protein